MKDIMIKDTIESERPRERLLKYGKENISNEDLISIILKTGTKEYSVKTLAKIVLSEIKDITKLQDITINKLIQIKGIGKIKAIELVSAIELGKRVYNESKKEIVILNSSAKVYEYFKNFFKYEKQENFISIYLDSKSKLISYKLLFKGTLNSSYVHPREVFKYAFLESAASIIVVHNHPSGDPTPSTPDIEITNTLFKAGQLILLPVVDHIIIGNNSYYSFYETMNKKRK